jgi:low affinity Fe/Cu permease
MFNIVISILNRLSTILALKALPNEAVLEAYMRNVFRAIFFLVLGSILVGAIIVALLCIVYDQMVNYGYSKLNAEIITIAIAFIIMVISFVQSCRCINNKSCKKVISTNIIDEKLDYIKDLASGTITGFIEGLKSKPKKPYR